MVAYWDKSGCSFQGENPAPNLLLLSKGRQLKEVLWHLGGACTTPGEREVGEKGNTSPLLSGGQVLRLEGFRSLPFLSAFYRLWKGTEVPCPLERDRCSCPPGRLVSSCMSKGTGHREIKDCDGIFRESAVQSRSSLYSFAPIAMAVFSNKQRGTDTLVLILAISSPTAQSHVYQPSTKGITV